MYQNDTSPSTLPRDHGVPPLDIGDPSSLVSRPYSQLSLSWEAHATQTGKYPHYQTEYHTFQLREKIATSKLTKAILTEGQNKRFD